MTSEQFLKHLRDALNHLHNPGRLRQSPLAALFGVENRIDTPSLLQRILVDAIKSLKPEADTPSDAVAWRIYELLSCRYIQQLSVLVVSNQLGISDRQLRREQRTALEALAGRLSEVLSLETKQSKGAGTVGVSTISPPTTPTVNDELAWLKDVPPGMPTDLHETLNGVLEVAQPLAGQHDVDLEPLTTASLPGLAVHPVALSQMLLNVLTAAIPMASGGPVRISAEVLEWEIEIRIWCAAPAASRSVLEGPAKGLGMANRLAEMCGGRLTLSEDEAAFGATLVLPCLEQLPVLVIDDNADTLQLLQRFTKGSRYRLVVTQDPAEAVRLAEELSPQIIVLDVMMPQVDGWRILGQLRQHPLTQYIPIAVCTVLTQEELALSLGASAFIRKPVTRQGFLAALDDLISGTDSEHH